MKKTYKVNNVEISAEEIKKLVKENPDIMEEKKFVGRFFFPEIGNLYRNYDGYGSLDRAINCDKSDRKKINMGVFASTEQAEKELERRKALVRIRKRVTENGLLFELDWSEPVFQTVYDTQKKEVSYIHSHHIVNPELPPFIHIGKTIQVHKACEEDYLIYFGKK